MNKLVYRGLSILEISKTLMYEFRFNIDSFIIHIKTKDFYEDIADDVKNRCDTLNYEVDRPLPKVMNKKVISLMKNELGGKIITEFIALRPKTYCYLKGDDKNVKKAKRTKKNV